MGKFKSHGASLKHSQVAPRTSNCIGLISNTETVIFVWGTGKDFVIQFTKLTFIYTQIIFVVLYMPYVYICLMFGNNRENEIQRSAGTILCCLATASDKNITISTKYDKYP